MNILYELRFSLLKYKILCFSLNILLYTHVYIFHSILIKLRSVNQRINVLPSEM